MPGPRVRRIPQRTCIACRRTSGKRELVRIVRTPAGEIAVDATGKLAGRGAYLCHDRRCWLAALKSKRIDQALKVTLRDEDRARLSAYGEQLPEETEEEASEDPSTGTS
ncbi:MAG: RNase P modulator RnpM [Anaerolineae bacterium]